MIPDKEYTVYFHGKIEVEAQTEDEAKEKAYDALNDTGAQFTITSTEEGECAECGGTGEVSCDESDGEGHIMHGVGTQKCLCQTKEADDHDTE